MAVEDMVHCSTVRVHSGGFWPRDIASRSSLLRFNDREFALVKDLIISTCFSKDDTLGVTLLRSSAWQSDPVYTPPMKTPAPAFARVTRRGSHHKQKQQWGTGQSPAGHLIS